MLMMAITVVMVPALVTASLVGLGRVSGSRVGGWTTTAAVGLGYVAGHLAVARPALVPVEVTDRLPMLALIATAFDVFEASWTPSLVVRRVGRGVLLALILTLVLGPVFGAGELSDEVVGGLAASALIAMLAWANVEALASRPLGHYDDVFRALLMTTGGCAVVLLLSGSAVLGFLGASLTSALVALRLASGDRTPAGWLTVTVSIVTFLVLEGQIYAGLTRGGAILLAFTPATAWFAWTRFGRRLGPALGALTALIPVAVAIALAIAASPGSEY